MLRKIFAKALGISSSPADSGVRGGKTTEFLWEWGPSTVRKLVFFLAFALAGVGLVAVPAPSAQAAPIAWSYFGTTGGTLVRVLDSTVQSDMTAQSVVFGGTKSSSSKNSTAAAEVGALASVGAIETTTSGNVSSLTGTTLRSWARTAHVSLLDGLITADAVETTITTTGRPDGSATSTANSRLANIKIAGIELPLNIPKNYQVTIPGIATVTMNYSLHGRIDELVGTIGWALGVHLLKARADYPAGAAVLINPVNQYLAESDPSNTATLAGNAYGTRVRADVGDEVKVVSDPTAHVGTPIGSSNGRTITNSTLSSRVSGLLTTGIIQSTTTSTKDAFGNAEIINTNRTAGLNVLNGLIKADAVKVTATSRLVSGTWTHSEKLELVNLVVAGQSIPIDVGPNTVINVADLGTVSINVQQASFNGLYRTGIIGVRIVLDTARAGLPVGAVVELGVANTYIAPPVAG